MDQPLVDLAYFNLVVVIKVVKQTISFKHKIELLLLVVGIVTVLVTKENKWPPLACSECEKNVNFCE